MKERIFVGHGSAALISKMVNNQAMRLARGVNNLICKLSMFFLKAEITYVCISRVDDSAPFSIFLSIFAISQMSLIWTFYYYY